ncbi:aldo/keto reductase [Planctomycetes bacterium Pan216]
MASSLMETVELRNGTWMPLLGLGTFKAEEGGQVEQAIKWALEMGYRSIDTASIYGNEAGVGKALAESGVPRDEIFLTTKLWNDDQGYDATMRAFDASLERLGTAYVDLYLVHWPVRDKIQETWQAMNAIHRSGRAKAIGVSNFLEEHLTELLNGSGITPMVNQIEFHPRLQQPGLIEFCEGRRIVVEAWSPLMRGEVLTIPELVQIGEKHGKSAAQVTLRWQIQRGIVTIPKTVNQDRLASNAAIFDFELTEEEMGAINALDQDQRTGPDPKTFGYS